jgi:hypothetical protein
MRAYAKIIDQVNSLPCPTGRPDRTASDDGKIGAESGRW